MASLKIRELQRGGPHRGRRNRSVAVLGAFEVGHAVLPGEQREVERLRGARPDAEVERRPD